MKGNYLKSSLSIFLAFVLLLGVLVLPVRAVGTTTAARIYSDFTVSPAYLRFSDFAELYDPEYASPIPGLGNTDINGFNCSTMVPHGICFAEEYLIISAYDSQSVSNSVLYVLSSETRTFLTSLVMPIVGKTGGIAFDGTSIWIANGKKMSGISYTTLDSAVKSALEDKLQSVPIKFISNCSVSINPGFLTYGDGMLWAGEYKDKGDASGKLYGYIVSADGKKLVKKHTIALPDRVRGISVQDGYLFLTRSDSRNISSSEYISQLRVYELSAPESDGTIKKVSTVTNVELPPMAEGITAFGGYLYLVFSSASNVHLSGSDGGGKCKYPVDRLIPFALSDLLDGHNAPSHDEIVNATVSLDSTFASMIPGAAMSLTASFSGGDVSWKSSNTAVASITVLDEKTVSVNALADGKATITCTLDNGCFAKCVITVEGDFFLPCSLEETSFADALMAQSYDNSLTTRTKIALANGMVTYTGTLEEDALLLVWMKAGRLINPGISYVVMEPLEVSLSKTKLDLKYGQKYQLSASFSEGTVSWKSSNNNVVVVESQDADTVMLKATGEGKATITCALASGNVAKCVVNVEYLYFDKCESSEESIVRALQAQDIDSSFETRTLIAEVNGISNYQGTADQNVSMLKLMAAGKLINPGLSSASTGGTPTDPGISAGIYFPQCSDDFTSLATALENLGYDSSFAFCSKIAEANGIANYTGTSGEDLLMLNLLKEGKLVKPDMSLESNEHLICFNPNGGEGVMGEIIFVNGDALPANVFTKEGYKFSGWATSATGNVVYRDREYVMLEANVTLYAVWEPIQYILRYHANDGEGTMEDTIVTYGVDSKLRTPAFTREGYTLTGWYRYRTSDNKWLYKSADGSTNAWYLEGEQPAGYAKNVMKTTSSVSKTSSLDGDVVILYAVWKKGNGISLDGKKVMFIGNSFIYYGGVVELGSPKKTDKGWFYDICKANGESTTVYDCTYGNHRLYDFTSSGCKNGSCHDGKDLLSGIDLKTIDVVFISESGNNNSNFVRDVKNVIKRFPSSTKFVYLSHSYSYIKNHTNITSKLGDLEKLGIMVVEWGKLVDDVIDGRTSVSGATVKYNKNTFIKNKGDTHHPNPLAGYITAQMAYCAVTGKSAIGQMPDVYENGKSVKYGQSVVGYSAFISKHYTSSTSSNFKTIMNSSADMLGLQKLMDKYLAKRGLGIDGNK